MVDLDDLVSAYDIAERLGLKHQRQIHNLRATSRDFPEPVLRTGKGGQFHLWLWSEVLEWAYRTGRVKLDPLRDRSS